MVKIFPLSLLFLASSVSGADFGPRDPASDESQAITVPLGGNAFLVSGPESNRISKTGISNWTDKKTVYHVFVHTAGAESINVSLRIETQEERSRIKVKIGDTEEKVTIRKNTAGEIEVGDFKFAPGYQKIEFSGLSKSGDQFARITDVILRSEDDIDPKYVKTNDNNSFYWGRRGPSVHLSYPVPEGKDYQWFYSEVTVPEGEDARGSFFMANGFGEGYFGFQVNSDTERRILFSVWSPFATDNPAKVPEEKRIVLLRKGKHVYSGEFGNEGSGGQSYLRFNWEAGTTYQFLNSVKPDGNGNTIYTGYFYAPEVGEWQIIASFKRPKTETWYQRPHSFLENFNPEFGYRERKAYYDNQWIRSTDGEWTELTEARFTGDTIATIGYRMDYAGGAEADTFYLQNCGFFDEYTPLRSMHSRPAKGHSPAIDFEFLKTLGSRQK